VDDQILKLFVGDSNVKGSRVTLPFMENLSRKNDPTGPNPILPKVDPTESSRSPVESTHVENVKPVLKTAVSLTPESGAPMYSGYLHERAHWKFGPRWNRHKAALYPKLLVVGSHSFQISSQEYQVAPAIEVHSRPFAFKLEKAKENQGESMSCSCVCLKSAILYYHSNQHFFCFRKIRSLHCCRIRTRNGDLVKAAF